MLDAISEAKDKPDSQILEGLNPKQIEAVTHERGPLLIVAGAGTGKTTVITRRIAYLIEHGAKPESILALAFGEKASLEMEERVDRLLPLGYYHLQISTFHAFCERILRDYGLEIGLPDFRIVNDISQWLLLRNNLGKFDLDYYEPLGNPTRFVRAMVTHFARAKDELITPEEYLDYAESLKISSDGMEASLPSEGLETKRVEEIANAFQVYQKLLLDNNALDFGDLINYTITLLKKRPKILDYFQNKYKHILVDEFQDTNYAQYELIKLLTHKAQNLTVVGDDDQSIFKFRGASISNILHFKADYPEAKFISLTDNYRTSQAILDKAYEFIQLNNPDRLEVQLNVSKKLFSKKDLPGDVRVISAPDAKSEAMKVVQQIIELKNGDPKLTWNDFAILGRSHDALLPFVSSLETSNLPFIYFANRGLYRKIIILDLISYFKLLDNYHDSSALYRVMNFPIFQITAKSLIELSAFAKRKSLSLYEATRLAPTVKNTDRSSLQGITKLLSCLENHTSFARGKTVEEIFVKVITDLRFDHRLDVNTREGQQNIRFLEKFGKIIQEFQNDSADKSLKVFMERFDLEIEAGEQGELEFDPEAGPEAIKLMTVHSAKGLEFTHVFVVSLVDKRFPTIERKELIEIPKSLIKDILPQGEAHLEEERRLFYVAMTRARQGLYLTYAQDYGGKQKKKPSRFLAEFGFLESLPPKKTAPTGVVDFISIKSVAKAISLPMPKMFSFSQISKFRTCPLGYKYQYVIKLPMTGTDQLSFGQSIHTALEKYLKLYRQQQKSPDLFGQVDLVSALPSLETLMDIYKKSWIDDWYGDKIQQEKYWNKGKVILRDFFESSQKTLPKPKYLEEQFKLKLGDALITGKIDRADETPDGLLIIDYKTGKVKLKLSGDDKEQLFLYQWAVEDFFQEKVAGLQYWFLAGSLKSETFKGTPDDIESLKMSFNQTIEEIRSAVTNNNFLALDTQTSHFAECKYRELET